MGESGGDFERLIETSKFPVELVSEKSAKEKTIGGKPTYWQMTFWWTRKPLTSARAVIAGALLPAGTHVDYFKRWLRLDESIPHRHNPIMPVKIYKKWFEGKAFLDPFAGFGSIPLEAIRLGLSKIVVTELLPAAYVFLKAILEHPLRYGKQLIRDIERWRKWIIEQLKKDLIIQQLYDFNVIAYIGSWEVKCPHCGKWTPLIANWWLARESKEKTISGEKRKVYTRLVWMKPKANENTIDIKIVDLNKELGSEVLKNCEVKKRGKLTIVTVGDKQYSVPAPNIDANREIAWCLHCGNPIRYINTATEKHYLETKKLNGATKEKIQWYVKYALKRQNANGNKLVKLKLLAKLNNNKRFEACTKEDQGKIELAKDYLRKLIEANDPDIPNETIAPYSTRFLHPINYYARTWRDLYNDRQLLTLIKLTKIIRKAGKIIEQEKINEGLNHEDAKRYAEAITTYLAIMLCRLALFNTIVTTWNAGSLLTNKVQSSLSFRGITMTWNWCDTNILYNEGNSYSIKGTIDAILRSLRYLYSAVPREEGYILKDYDVETIYENLNTRSEKLRQDVTVLLEDATTLSKVNSSTKFDVIVTDPPYYSDVPYTELSDFYYVWLKRALSDIRKNRLTPRFLPEAFFEKVGVKITEIKTQWRRYGEREVSVKLASKEIMERGIKRFLELLKMSFLNCALHLSDNGLLVTYYAHTSPEAWIALLEAGWKGGKFHVVNAFPIATESLQRVTARGKYALDTSIVVVWRKGCLGSISVDNLYEKAVREATLAAVDLIKLGRTGSDLFVGTMASILSIFTRYEKLYGPTGLLDVKSLVTDYVYPATAKALAMALGKFAGSPGEVKRPESLFYLITKALFPKIGKAKRKLDRTNIALISIGTKADINTLQKFRIMYREKANFYLEEPATEDRKSFEEILREKGINPAKPVIESTIDAFHLLEYYSITLPLNLFLAKFLQVKEEYSNEVEEAINIAAILAKVLPSTDPEKKACEEIIARIKGEKLA